MFASRILRDESCINDAYVAAFMNLKKRSETPKQKPRPASIWDLENDGDNLGRNQSSQDNRHVAGNVVKDNFQSRASNYADSFGRNSSYKVGDEAICGNISDLKYPSNKINPGSDMTNTKSANHQTKMTKTVTFQIIPEKISHDEEMDVLNEVKNEDMDVATSLDKSNSRSKNKITPEKYVPRKRPCIIDINSFDPHPSKTVSNLSDKFASDQKENLLTNKSLKAEFYPSLKNCDSKSMIADDISHAEGTSVERFTSVKNILVENASHTKNITVEENYHGIKTFKLSNKGIENLKRIASEINEEKTKLVKKTIQDNSKIPDKDFSKSLTFKNELNRIPEDNLRNASHTKNMSVEENSHEVHDVLKEKNGIENIEHMSSEIKSMLNIPQNNNERNHLVRKTIQDINKTPDNNFSKSFTFKNELNRTPEDNWQNCWEKSESEQNDNAKYHYGKATKSVVKKEFSNEKDSNRKSPPLTRNEKKSPSLDDWLKKREQSWKNKKNSDVVEKENRGFKNNSDIIVSEGEQRNQKDTIMKNANINRYEPKDGSGAPKISANEARHGNTSTTLKNSASDVRTGKRSDSAMTKDSVNEADHGNKNIFTVTKDSACSPEIKKIDRTPPVVHSVEPTCPEKDVMICLQVHDQSKTSDLIVEKKVLEHIQSRRPEIRKLIPPTNSRNEELPYSCKSIMILFRSLFSSYQQISSWKVALEVLSLSNKYKLKRLKKISERYFAENPPTLLNVEEIVHNAVYLKVLHDLNKFVKIEGMTLYQFLCKTSLSNEFQLISSSCFVSTKLLVEPSEFCIPLIPVKHDFSAAFKKDIRNVLVFEAIRGTYNLTGIQIKFDVNSVETVNIEYTVSKGNKMLVSEEKEKRLRSLIILNFGKDIVLQPSEKAEVSIMVEDIQPRICQGASNLKLVQNSGGCHFTTTLSSNVSPCLIFIEKLFYTVNS